MRHVGLLLYFILHGLSWGVRSSLRLRGGWDADKGRWKHPHSKCSMQEELGKGPFYTI